MVLRDRTEQADFSLRRYPHPVISNGAGRLFLPHLLLQMRRLAQREISLPLLFLFSTFCLDGDTGVLWKSAALLQLHLSGNGVNRDFE
jgi:hypothetical protein